MLYLAIITPTVGALYLVWQIHKRDLRGWQHYACLTSLVFLISILFLVGSGRVESFGLAGNTVKVVDQKLDEIKLLSEQNKRIAQLTAELVIHATGGLITTEEYDPKEMNARLRALLKEAGLSSQQIEKLLTNTNQTILKIE